MPTWSNISATKELHHISYPHSEIDISECYEFQVLPDINGYYVLCQQYAYLITQSICTLQHKDITHIVLTRLLKNTCKSPYTHMLYCCTTHHCHFYAYSYMDNSCSLLHSTPLPHPISNILVHQNEVYCTIHNHLYKIGYYNAEQYLYRQFYVECQTMSLVEYFLPTWTTNKPSFLCTMGSELIYYLNGYIYPYQFPIQEVVALLSGKTHYVIVTKTHILYYKAKECVLEKAHQLTIEHAYGTMDYILLVDQHLITWQVHRINEDQWQMYMAPLPLSVTSAQLVAWPAPSIEYMYSLKLCHINDPSVPQHHTCALNTHLYGIPLAYMLCTMQGIYIISPPSISNVLLNTQIPQTDPHLITLLYLEQQEMPWFKQHLMQLPIHMQSKLMQQVYQWIIEPLQGPIFPPNKPLLQWLHKDLQNLLKAMLDIHSDLRQQLHMTLQCIEFILIIHPLQLDTTWTTFLNGQMDWIPLPQLVMYMDELKCKCPLVIQNKSYLQLQLHHAIEHHLPTRDLALQIGLDALPMLPLEDQIALLKVKDTHKLTQLLEQHPQYIHSCLDVDICQWLYQYDPKWLLKHALGGQFLKTLNELEGKNWYAQWLVLHHQYEEAYGVYMEMATMTNVDLTDRLVYVDKALYLNATDEAKGIKRLLNIQEMVYKHCGDATLKTNWKSSSQLFNDYAVPYKMYDVQVLLYDYTQFTGMSLIEESWKQLIETGQFTYAYSECKDSFNCPRELIQREAKKKGYELK